MRVSLQLIKGGKYLLITTIKRLINLVAIVLVLVHTYAVRSAVQSPTVDLAFGEQTQFAEHFLVLEQSEKITRIQPASYCPLGMYHEFVIALAIAISLTQIQQHKPATATCVCDI